MRSLYIDKSIHDFSHSYPEVVLKEKDKLHHLNNVLRLKLGTKVLLFNEDGYYCSSELIELAKRVAKFKVSEQSQYVKPHNVELALCWLKKDALEDAVTNAVQTGVTTIHLVKSEYSQLAQDLTKSRFQKILTSAMEQSNHFIKPSIIEYASLADLIESNKDVQTFGFTLHKDIKKNEVVLKPGERCIYLIGPEGGLSKNEIKELDTNNVKFFHLNMPIMRAPVAVSCALGYIVAQIK